jgi:hypothetical protein
MAIEAKEILDYLGFDSAKISDIDTFKKEFEPEAGKPVFVRSGDIKKSHVYSSIVGELTGSIQTKVKAIAKKFAVDLTKEEIEGKQVEDIVALVLEKQAEGNKSIVDELTSKVGLGNDEKVKEWQDKYSKIESKFNDTKSLLEKTNSDFNSYKETAASQLKNQKLDIYKKDVFSKLKFKQNATELEKIGFNAKISEKFDFDLDENDSFFVKEKKSGARIPSTKVTGQFMSAEEVLEKEIVELGLFEKTPTGGVRVGLPLQPREEAATMASSKLGNKLHPSRGAR